MRRFCLRTQNIVGLSLALAALGSGSVLASDAGVVGISATPVIKGALSKDEVRHVLKRNNERIRYCYEQQLLKNPKLKGTASVRFVIVASGLVSTSELVSTTINNKNVEDCLVKAVSTFQFPKPKGNGSVTVTYPFTFAAPEAVSPDAGQASKK